MSRWSYRTTSDVPPLNAPLADRWHDRAHESEAEERRVLTSLATGVIAAFFIALTGDSTPRSSLAERCAATIALCAESAAIFLALFAWYADSRRSYHEGNCYQKNAAGDRTRESNLARKWSAYAFRSHVLLRLSFAVGIVAAALYAAARAW